MIAPYVVANIPVSFYRRKPGGALHYRFTAGGERYRESTGVSSERDARAVVRPIVIKALEAKPSQSPFASLTPECSKSPARDFVPVVCQFFRPEAYRSTSIHRRKKDACRSVSIDVGFVMRRSGVQIPLRAWTCRNGVPEFVPQMRATRSDKAPQSRSASTPIARSTSRHREKFELNVCQSCFLPRIIQALMNSRLPACRSLRQAFS